MTYSQLLSFLLVVLVSLAVVVVLAILVNLFRTSSGRKPRKSETPKELPRGTTEALRHAIRYAALVRDGDLGKPEVAQLWENLKTADRLTELTIFKHYFGVAFSDSDEEGRYDALQRLCEVLQGDESGDPESQAQTALYLRLLALARDLREGNADLPRLRAAVAEPVQAVGPSKDWIGKHLEELLEGADRLSFLSTRELKLATEPDRRAADRQPESFSEDQLRRELQRLIQQFVSPTHGRFRQEYALLQSGFKELLLGYLPLLATVAPSSVSPGVRPSPEQPPLRVKPEEIRLLKHSHPRDLRITLRLENISQEATDRVRVKWFFVADQEGAQNEQTGKERSRQIDLIAPGRGRDLALELNDIVSEGTLHFDIEYRGAESQLLGFGFTVPVRYVDPFKLNSPYANRVQQAATYFVGRSHALEHLNQLARSNESKVCVVSGLPNIGKTALLYEVRKRCDARQDRWAKMRAIVFNLDNVQFSRPDWPSQILQGVKEEISKQVGPFERQTTRSVKRRHAEGGAYEPFTDFLDMVNTRLENEGDLRLLLMMDEYHRIEELFPIKSDDARLIKADFVQFLRRVADNFPRILLVLSGYHSLSYVARKSTGTVWTDVLGKVALGREIELGFLQRDEAMDLIVNPMFNVGINYREGDGVEEEFFRGTNGYPWAIQDLGEKLFEQAVRRYAEGDETESEERRLEVDRNLWRRVKNSFVAPRHHMFERIWLGEWLDRLHFALGIALAQVEDNDRLLDKEGVSWIDRHKVLDRFVDLPALTQPNIIQRTEELVEKRIFDKMEQSGRAYLRLTVPLMEEWLRLTGDFDGQLVDAGIAGRAGR